MDRSDFPWRPLGRLLVEEGLLRPLELERALTEQRRTGRLLGQILVAEGRVTGIELARALARQHGVDVQPASRPETTAADALPAGATSTREPWHSLGMLLARKGLVAPAALQQALAEQRERPERRLGEILVERGYLSAPTLASVLAEQHGVTVEAQLVAGAQRPPGARDSRTYVVYTVDEASRRRALYEGPSLLDASDVACDHVDEAQPPAVEIELHEGTTSKVVWTYTQERAAEAALSGGSLVERFGFDPTRWGTGR
jgi:hypothetical protein